MKNKDHPASPTTIALDFSDTDINGGTNGKLVVPGLTKREYAAIHALSGLLTTIKGVETIEQIAQLAVLQADALFDQLEKE